MTTKKEERKPQMQALFMQKMEGLKNPKFSIKETDFSIEKLPPMKAFSIAEEIRHTLAETADKFNAGDGSEEQSATLFFKALLGLPPVFIEYLMSVLFEDIQFSGKNSGIEKGWAKLKGLEDSAFINFEVINIYEVLWRALYINFSGSFSEIISAFPGMDQILSRLKA